MKGIFHYFGGAFLLFMLLVTQVSAASLYIDPARSEINRGDSITLSVRLDTDESIGECVNAVDGVIMYSENIDPVDVSIGESIFSMWVEQPTINREDRTITFAGGIPNGYCGRVSGDPRLTNSLAKIVFRSPGFAIGGGAANEKTASVSFADSTTALLNDGLGTEAPLRLFGAEIILNDRAGATLENDWQEVVDADTIPPEEFSIALQKDTSAFAGRYFIVFNTTDKQTGIDHYEVMEEPLTQFGSFQWGRADAPWIRTRSPYVLDDQSLNSIIRVKAVDKAGNEYIANLIPDESIRTLSSDQVFNLVAVAIGVVLLIVVAFALWQFRLISKKRRRDSEDDLETGVYEEYHDDSIENQE